jgi:hypothetical protein
MVLYDGILGRRGNGPGKLAWTSDRLTPWSIAKLLLVRGVRGGTTGWYLAGGAGERRW